MPARTEKLRSGGEKNEYDGVLYFIIVPYLRTNIISAIKHEVLSSTLYRVFAHSFNEITAACLGNTFPSSTLCTSSSISAQRSESTVS